MIVVIAGGGRTGAQLASFLLSQDHEVHLIEHRKDVLTRLHKELPTEVIFEGNAANPEVLEHADICRAQVLAACTPDDADNLAICYLARAKYNIPRTIGRINNPRNAWLFDRKFHVDVALNQAGIMASLIQEEMSLGDMMTLLKLRRGEYSVIEEKIPPGAKAIGVAIKDLQLCDDCVIAAIIRHGRIVVPRGITEFEAHDEVLAVTSRVGAEQLASLFAPPGKAEG